ncbi:NUDIX hydrolase N-terminal domain-containing protein [Halostella litorea]|uniref:NUDIX hydrolase N-terminal domain-containing protein n=1 Tax=Halostella litorea TaxID=2528831 RepID=UPI00109308CF|nr:NUDIX hydrolase N-terminal domain-containing protein [Halostella litorea]
MPPSDDAVDLLALLDELRVIAGNGLEYADDPYDRERYERLDELVDEYYGRTLDLPAPEVRERLAGELGHVTPKLGATGAVIDDEGRLLTMQRPVGEWCLPGGHADPGEAPEETVVREVREETGLDVRPVELVDAYELPPGSGYDPHGAVTLLYRCERVGGDLELSHEGLDLRWQEVDAVDDWYTDHERYARDALAAADG